MQTKQLLDRNQKIRPPKIKRTNSITQEIQAQEVKDQVPQKILFDNSAPRQKKSGHDYSMGSQNGNPQRDLQEGNQNIMRQFAAAWKSQSGFSILLIQKLSLIVNNYFRMIGQMAQRNDEIQVLIVYNKTLIEILNKFEDQQRKLLQKLRTMQEFNLKIMKQLCALKKRQFLEPQLKPQESIFSKFSLSDLKYTPPPKDEIHQDESYKKKLLELFKNYLLEKNDHYLPIVQHKISQIQPSIAQKSSLLLQSHVEDLKQLLKDIVSYNKGLNFVDCNNMFDLYEMKCSIKTQMKNLNIDINSAITDQEQNREKQFVNNVLKIQAGLTQMNQNQLQTYLRKQKQVRKKIKKQRLKQQEAFIRTCQHVQNQNIQLKKDIQQLRQKNNALIEQLQRIKAKQQFKLWRKNKSGLIDQSIMLNSQGSQDNQNRLIRKVKYLQEQIQKIKEQNLAGLKQLQQKRTLEIQNEARRRLIIQSAKDFNIILQSNDSIIRNMEVLVEYCIKKSNNKQLVQSDNLAEVIMSPFLEQGYEVKILQNQNFNSQFFANEEQNKNKIKQENKDFKKKQKQSKKQQKSEQKKRQFPPKMSKSQKDLKHLQNSLQKQQKNRIKQTQNLQNIIIKLESEKEQLLKKISQIQNQFKKNEQKILQMEKSIQMKDQLISSLQLKQQQENTQKNKLQKQLQIKQKQRTQKQNQHLRQLNQEKEKTKQYTKQIQNLSNSIKKITDENKQLLFYNQCAQKLSFKFMKAFQVLINQDITSDKYLSTLDKLVEKLRRYLTQYKKQTKKQTINLTSITLNSDDGTKGKCQPILNENILQYDQREYKGIKKQYRDFGVNVSINTNLNEPSHKQKDKLSKNNLIEQHSIIDKKDVGSTVRKDQKERHHHQEQSSKILAYSQSQTLKKSQGKQQKQKHNPLNFVQSARSVNIKAGQIQTQNKYAKPKQLNRLSSSGQSARKIDYQYKPIYVLNSDKQIKSFDGETNQKMSISYAKIRNDADLTNQKKETQVKKQTKSKITNTNTNINTNINTNTNTNNIQKTEVIFKKADLPIINYSPSIITHNNQINQREGIPQVKKPPVRQQKTQQQKINTIKKKKQNKSDVQSKDINNKNSNQINQISNLILKSSSKQIKQNQFVKQIDNNSSSKKQNNNSKLQQSKYQVQLNDSPIKIRVSSPNFTKKNNEKDVKETNKKKSKQKQKQKQKQVQVQKKVPPIINNEQKVNKNMIQKQQNPIKKKSQKIPQFPPLFNNGNREPRQERESKEPTISIRLEDRSNINNSRPPQMVNLQISLSQQQDILHQELQQGQPIGNSYILNQINQKTNNTRNINRSHNRNQNPSGNNSRAYNRARLDRSAQLAGVQARYVQLLYQRLQRLNNDTDVLDFYQLYQRYKQAMSCLYKSEQVNRLNQIRYQRFIQHVNMSKEVNGPQSIINQLYFLERRVREQQTLLEQQKIQFQNQVQKLILDSQRNIKETLKILRKQYNKNIKANQQTRKFTF